MSVLGSHRSESKAEFVNTANEIFVRTITFLSRLSARYSRLLAEKTSDLANDLLDESEKANSLFPDSRLKIDLRETHLREALATLKALDVKLDKCYQILICNPEGAFTDSKGNKLPAHKAKEKLDNMAQVVGELIDKEDTLLKGQLDFITEKRKSVRK